MSVLRISLFGGVVIARDVEARIDQPHDDPPASATRHVLALFAYLLLQPRRCQPREVLADVFWGNRSPDKARSCLNTAVWRLRRVLEPDGIPSGTYLITTPGGEIGFNWHSDHWLDLTHFERGVQRGLAHPIETLSPTAAAELEQALNLYTGDLLEGFYDDWALRERERLRQLYLNGLAYLMHYHRQQLHLDLSLRCGQRILELDPLREEIHREIIQLYRANGQRALAIRQYEACRDLLRTELGIAPLPETQALYAQLAPDTLPDPADPLESLNLHTALRQLKSTQHLLTRVHDQLAQASQLIERLLNHSDAR